MITDVCFAGRDRLCSTSSENAVSIWDIHEGHRYSATSLIIIRKPVYGLYEQQRCRSALTFRDYHNGILVNARSINRRPHYQARERSRADNGRGLILRAMTKVPCYNLFITYSETFFRIILIKNTKKIMIFIPK